MGERLEFVYAVVGRQIEQFDAKMGSRLKAIDEKSERDRRPGGLAIAPMIGADVHRVELVVVDATADTRAVTDGGDLASARARASS